MRLRWLSPEIVDLIAAGLPALTALDLNFAEVVHQEPSSDASSVDSVDSNGLSRESELAVEKVPNCSQALLPVDYVISVGLRGCLAPI